MRRLAATVTALLAFQAALPAAAEEIVARLNHTQVAITAGFDGSEIFVYGAVRREAPASAVPLDVVVVIVGPSEPVVVRRKVRRMGIWVNDEGVQVDAAPSFYAVASTRGFRETISYTDDLRYRVGLDHAVRLIGETDYAEYPADYRQAVIRLRREQGLYLEVPGGVEIAEDTLFSASFQLPASLVEGDYRARIFLTRDRHVIDAAEETIAVRKVGIERWLYTLSRENGLLYGALSILVGLAVGWLASAAFRLLFP